MVLKTLALEPMHGYGIVITRSGRHHLKRRTGEWERRALAVRRVLRAEDV